MKLPISIDAPDADLLGSTDVPVVDLLGSTDVPVVDLLGSTFVVDPLVELGDFTTVPATATQTNFLFFLSHIKVLPETFVMEPGLVQDPPSFAAANACGDKERDKPSAKITEILENLITRCLFILEL